MKRISWIILITFVLNISMFTLLMGKEKVPVPVPKTHTEHLQFLIDSIWQAKFLIDYTPETYLKVVKSYMGFVLPPPPALIGAVPVYYLIKFVKGAWNIIKGTFGKLYHSRYAFSHMKHSTWGYVFELFKGGIMIVVGEIATHTVALLTVTTGVGAAANVAIFLSMLYVDKWISMVESKKGVVDYHLLSKEYSFSKSDYWNLFYSFPNAITSDLVETGHIGKCLNDKSFNYFMSFDKHIDDFEQFVETKQISIFNQRTKVDGQMSKAMKKLQQSSSNITTANMSNIKNSRRKLRRLKSISAKLKNQAHHLKSYKSLLKEQAKISRKMKKIYDPIGKSVRGYMKGATRAGKNTLLTSVGNADQFVRKSKDLKRLNRLNNNLRLSMGKITRNHLDDFLKKSRNCKKFIMKSNKLTRGLAKLSKYKSRVTAIAKGLKNKIPDIIGIALDTIDWMDIAPPTLETSMLTDEADGIGLNFAKNNLFEGTFYLKDSGCGINTKSFELKIDNDKQFFNRYDDLEKAVVVRNKKLNYFEINESFASRFVRLEDQFKLVEAKFKIKNPVKDKVYDFSVFVRDRAGHPSKILKFKSKIVDDNTPPKIEFIEPKPFSEYKPGSPVNIKISLIEKESMIDWRKIKLKLYSKSTISQNDMIIPLRKTNFIKADFLDNRKFDYYFRNGLIELTMPSGFKREKGIYTIKIESENAAGVSSEEEVSFFVGNLNPVQFIPHFYPESMEYLPESEISFGYTVLNTLGEGSSIKEVKIELGQLPKGMELKSSKKTVSASNIITSYDFLKSQPFKFVLNKNVVRGLHYIPFTARFKINSLEKQIQLKVEIKIQEKVGNVRSYLETDVSFETREGDVRPLPKGTRIFVNQIYKFPSYGMPKNIEQNIGEGLVLNDNGFVRIEITPVYPGKKKRLRIVAQAMLYDFIPAKVQSKSRRLIGAVVHRGRQPYKCIAEYQRVAPARSPLRGVILNKMPAVIIPCHGLKEVGILIPWEGELSTGGFINYGSPLMSSFSSSIGGNLKNFSENLRGGMNTTPGLYYKNHNGALEIISTLRKCFEQASKFYMLSRVLANNSGRFIPVIVEKDSLQQGEGDTVPSVSTIETEETNEEIDEKEYYEKKARLQKYASEVIIDDISDEEDEDTSEEIDEKLSSNSSVYRFLLTYPKEGIISEYIFNDSYFYKSRVFRNGFSSPKWAAYLSENVMIVCDSDDNKVKAITQYGSLIWEVSFNALPVKAYMLSSGTVCVLTSDSRLSLCTTGGDIFKSFAGPYKDITLTSDSSQIIALGNTEIQILNDVDQNVKTIPIGITADKISGNEDCIYVSDGSKVLKIKSGEKEVYSGAVSNIFNIYGDELCFVEDSKKIFRKPEKQKYCIFSDSGAFNSISGMFSFGFPRTKEKDDKEKKKKKKKYKYEKKITKKNTKTEKIKKSDIKLWTEKFKNAFLQNPSKRKEVEIPGITVKYFTHKKKINETHFDYTKKSRLPTLFVKGGEQDPDDCDPSLIGRAYSTFLRNRLNISASPRYVSYLAPDFMQYPYLFKKRVTKYGVLRNIDVALRHGYDIFLSCYFNDSSLYENTNGKMPLWGIDIENDVLKKLEQDFNTGGLDALKNQGDPDVSVKSDEIRGLDNSIAVASIMWKLYKTYGDLFIANLLSYAQGNGKLMDTREMLKTFSHYIKDFLILGLTPVMIIESPMNDDGDFLTNSLGIRLDSNEMLANSSDMAFSIIYDENSDFSNSREIHVDPGETYKFGKVFGTDKEIIEGLKNRLGNGTYYFKVEVADGEWVGCESGVSAINISIPSQMVDHLGGSIDAKGKNGSEATVNIPSGAVNDKVDVTASNIDFSTNPSKIDVLGDAGFDFGPHGYQFDKPVDISFKVKETERKKYTKEEIQVYRLNERTNTFELVNSKIVNEDTISATTYSFSVYFVGVDTSTPVISNVNVRTNPYNPLVDGMNIIEYDISKWCTVEAEIIDDQSNNVFTQRYSGISRMSVSWDGYQKDGTISKDGIYFLKLTAYDKGGRLSKPYIQELYLSQKSKLLTGEVSSENGEPVEISVSGLNTILETGSGTEYALNVPEYVDRITFDAKGCFPKELDLKSEDLDLNIALKDHAFQWEPEVLKKINVCIPETVIISGKKGLLLETKNNYRGVYRSWLEDEKKKKYILEDLTVFFPGIRSFYLDGSDLYGKKIHTGRYKLIVECYSNKDLYDYFKRLGILDNYLQAIDTGMISELFNEYDSEAFNEYLSEIAVYEPDINVYIDRGICDTYMILPAMITPDGDGMFDDCEVCVDVITKGKITINVMDLSGNLIRKLAENLNVSPGSLRFIFDGKDDRGIFIPDGKYRIELNSWFDKPEMKSSVIMSNDLLVDRLPPVLGKLNIANGEKIKSTLPKFIASIDSPLNDLDPGEIYFKLDEFTIRPDKLMTDEKCFVFQPSTSIGYGEHIIIAYARDIAKNNAKPVASYFIIEKPEDVKDVEKPVIDLEIKNIYYSTTPALQGSIRDYLSGVSRDGIEIYLDGERAPLQIKYVIPGKSGEKWDKYYYYKSILLYDPYRGSFFYRPLKPLKEGLHDFKIIVKDKEGNVQEASDGFTIKKDTLAPSIVESDIKSEYLVVDGKTNEINVTIIDRGGSGISINSIKFMIDGKQIPNFDFVEVKDKDLISEIVNKASGVLMLNNRKSRTKLFKPAIYKFNVKIPEDFSGGRMINLVYSDRAGNKGESLNKIVKFIKDTQIPEAAFYVYQKSVDLLRYAKVKDRKKIEYTKQLGQVSIKELRPVFTAKVKDNIEISKVEFSVDGVGKVATKNKDEYYLKWDRLQYGNHHVEVKAIDTSGNKNFRTMEILIKKDLMPPDFKYKVSNDRILEIDVESIDIYEGVFFVDGHRFQKNMNYGKNKIDLNLYFLSGNKHFISFYLVDKSNNKSKLNKVKKNKF